MGKYRLTILITALSLILLGVYYWNERPTSQAQAAEQVRERPSIAAGKEIYEQNCMSCHAQDGHGIQGKYPDLVSDHFRKGVGKSFVKAYEFVSTNMPQNAPGSLMNDEYQSVVKYIMSLNGIPTDFVDIDDYWAKNEINDLFDKKFIDGYTVDGQLYFKPQQNITRGEFVRYLVKSKEMYLSNDVNEELIDIAKSKDKIYITTAIDYGLIEGYEDHTFRPNKTITRAEVAAILTRSEGLPEQTTKAFSDLPLTHWANAEVGAAVEAKLFDGYDDGKFRPSQPITRGEAAGVIYRLIHPS
jgi:mono/diheme cytochrome c family protein